jgi:hypothetical protein
MFKMRYLGLFALAPLMTMCQPACAPLDEEPVAIEETVAPPPETTPPPVTTAPPTTAANLNPLNIRFSGFFCDESQTMSGWSSGLGVEIRHDGPWDAPGVLVTYEAQDGSLITEELAAMNPGEMTGLGWTGWPRVSDVYGTIEFHTFRPSQRVRVTYQGTVIFEQTFTLDDVKRITPPCAAVIDTPGVSG